MRYLIVPLILIHGLAYAQLDEHEKKGLEDTQNLLKSPSQRKEFIDKDKKAKDVDNKVEALTGPGENKEEIYGIASKVMEKITIDSAGDPEKMQRLLLEAQGNPKAFYEKYFGAEEKARVKSLSNKIEQRQGLTTTAPKK